MDMNTYDMKHIKLFESFEDIDSICKKYRIKDYTINTDGSVDVDGTVNLTVIGLTKLPLRFRNVSGSFYCRYNKLTTLEGSPESVGGTFDCCNNHLTTLEGAPERVGGDFNCNNNKLTTLEGSPREVGGDFYCYNNKLTTLEGAPERIGRHFDCNNNKLTTLEGSPREVGGYFDCSFNPIDAIYGLFNSDGRGHKDFMDSLDWDYNRGNKIVKYRFEDACAEAGIEVPKSIKGYEYI